MAGRAKNYVGAAGELRAASELSIRGYATHIPTVDEGGDLFAVDEDNATYNRVQVKTSTNAKTTVYPNCVTHQVTIKGGLLQATPDLYFVFHCLHDAKWHTLVFSQAQLLANLPGVVPAVGGHKNLKIVFNQVGAVFLGSPNTGANVTARLDDWATHFPVLGVTGTNF